MSWSVDRIFAGGGKTSSAARFLLLSCNLEFLEGFTSKLPRSCRQGRIIEDMARALTVATFSGVGYDLFVSSVPQARKFFACLEHLASSAQCLSIYIWNTLMHAGISLLSTAHFHALGTPYLTSQEDGMISPSNAPEIPLPHIALQLEKFSD